ncbi:response regulator transcription factor [Costertonia aggregata]|uniref:Response regulator transcription factor n=1 Tax=Costertonia aggregata TaxID=343403 RepID=A0A7H9AJJ7_9FLAO|nr:response regulator transcription factor [Costertonia aggregata]QLG43821.1 response regulator transcription factor [Costertonia aggregata]
MEDSKKVLRILAVDDHTMITLGYKYTLEGADFEDYEVKMEIANTYELGKKKIENSVRGVRYHMIMLDIQLSHGKDAPLKTGEQLGLLAREIVPNSKVVFMSSYSDNYRINQLTATVNPDGYLVKDEVDELTLKAMLETVMGSDIPYYTASALFAIRKKLANSHMIDELDKKILYRLSLGEKTKDMKGIEVSITTIEKRKRNMKAMFGIEKENDLALIAEAKNRGFI